ncbi:MAG: hypothetical protein M1812_001328 [Candelaria pacifica]|nr:MAG: hypothetical protein M1812_001328 [Candelaria pacifica]
MSKVIRGVKNVTKGYSTVQVKVRNATSNDPWGPTGTDMSEIAQLTFNNSNDFYEIMDMLDKRINDKGKNWRHVLKSLKVLDYCLHEGSELVVTWARKNIHIIKTLREFQYIDEDGRDVGQNVRVSAKELTSLIMDEERLRTERADRKTWKTRVTGIEEFGPQSSYGASSSTPNQERRRPAHRKQRADEEDAEYKLALEASKYEAEEDEKRRKQRNSIVPEDDDLAKAIKLSKEEEELRRKELEESNASSLFDATPAQSNQPQFTGANQGYQQQGAVDWFGNPIEQQQPQSTGYLNNAYSQPTGLQGQPTGYQNGFSNGFGAQPTGMDPNQFQTQQQQSNYMQPQSTIQPQSTLQPQSTSFNNLNNPYAQQSNDPFGGQQLQQQQTSYSQAGSHNPWATNQQHSQPEALKPAPTGSNNPFASSFTRPQVQQQQTSPPTLNSLQEQKTQTQFNNQSYNPPTAFAPQLSNQKEQNPQHAHLNALLSSGEGQDTFGNVGNLRIPAQHTAPGTFVNSSGQGIDRLHSSQTGNNPFFSQQFTGAPQQAGFAQQPNRIMPAQTGPAGVNGFGSSPFGGQSTNPFGSQPNRNQQHQQPQQQSGSLIDF